MKQTKLALSAVMIVAVGLIGANFVTGSEMTEQEKFDAMSDSGSIYGHVTVVHSDPDGNILSYAQMDNFIANDGKDCMAALIFGSTAGGTECTAATDVIFNRIVLFDGDSFAVTMNASGLLGSVNEIIGTGISIATADSLLQNAPATGSGYTDGTGGSTDIVKAFTAGSGVTNQNIDGAALLNTNDDAVLAGQVFSSAVTLNDGDSLTVTWTITLG